MAAFDLFAMNQQVLNGDMQTYEILTNTRVRRLIKQGVRCGDPDAVLRAFWAAAYELLQVHAPELGANPKFDNRAAWRSIPKSPSELTSLANFYLGFLDGSNVCERSLGRMSKQRLQHLGPLEENGMSLTMFLELKEDGHKLRQTSFVGVWFQTPSIAVMLSISRRQSSCSNLEDMLRKPVPTVQTSK